MRVYMRTGRGSGVSLGPIGLLIVAPLYMGFLALVILGGILVVSTRIVVAVITAVMAQRQRTQRQRARTLPVPPAYLRQEAPEEPTVRVIRPTRPVD